MYVTVEIVVFIQLYFINNDRSIYSAKEDMPAKVSCDGHFSNAVVADLFNCSNQVNSFHKRFAQAASAVIGARYITYYKRWLIGVI
jgi:hypothetical protein